MDSGISNSDSDMSNLLNTPSKPTAHSAATFAATYVSQDTRSELVDTLIGRVHYDIPDLLSKKLGIDKVDDTFVRECVAHLQALPDLETLRDLVSSKSAPEAKLEKRMYEPLVRLTNIIITSNFDSFVHPSRTTYATQSRTSLLVMLVRTPFVLLIANL